MSPVYSQVVQGEDGCMGGWVGGSVDGWMDGQVDRYTDKHLGDLGRYMGSFCTSITPFL